MTDGRTEDKHANSYAVETGGWKDIFGNKRRQNDIDTKRKQELSRQNVLELMSQEVAQLREQVKALNRGQAAQARSLAQEMSTIDELEEQVSQMKVEHNKLYESVHNLEVSFSQFVKEQRDFNKQSAGTMEAMSALILKNIR